MEQKERYAESYKITQAIHIGTSEIVIGIDMKAKDNMYYMVADYENNGIFEKYNNALVSDSYTEILSIFTERINNGLAQIQEIEKTVPSQQKWTQKSFKKRNESQYFVNSLKPTAFIPRFA